MKGIWTLPTWGPGFLGLFSQCIISICFSPFYSPLSGTPYSFLMIVFSPVSNSGITAPFLEQTLQGYQLSMGTTSYQRIAFQHPSLPVLRAQVFCFQQT